MSVKHYKNNLAYELLIDDKYHYYGSHSSKKEYLTPSDILYRSGNQIMLQVQKHEVTRDEYRSRVKLIMVWEFDTHEEALVKEAELITAAYENDRESCFNQNIGSNKEFKYSEELREKREQITTNFLHKGIISGLARSKPIKQLSLSGETITVYPSAHEAERQTGIQRVNIRNVINGKFKTAGGFKWEYA